MNKHVSDRLAKLVRDRNDLFDACKFLMSQVDTLARHAFSDGVDEWLEKNDAMNCGKRAIAQAEKNI